MPKITKAEAIKMLSDLPEETLSRMAELSSNKKAMSYFSNNILFALLKSYL
ncbi:hypothetical protein [Tenacibaculum finnmarkense]|uniref:hypothetical protein n=1 Tax=Tenacibaculum finnmarkense TaxID=2781243 RepID=UPI00187BBEC5|nr:hypothetical protein [Tenacibaculum finnmarkense]MBE7660966.1 hypothetical protein [Tenacibaculum finnmarkense genomovar finnmarkense]MCG8253072.1 hypothetical protein [Tenacibaculum finnmarkense genomovar finnmarkense]MCG8732351.1 hypothetical protein [Tenacibaculum finnmarkense]MCG8753104.1 hypothetical protein [Tenacibaculum finnmarkense]MCG8773862.1 hypothetical protein [Tenacibaculum finnmarkense]